MPIRIAHISDPHFGSANQQQVWQPVAVHLRAEALHFLVVTGDTADSPKRKFFDDAHNAFEALQVPYLVVPGNHDRFTKGNNILNKLVRQLSDPSEYFDQVFQGLVAVPDSVATRPLADAAYRRTLRIVGIDSSRHADFFARGYVLPKDMLSAAKTMSGSTGSDLKIALVHHHLLAVRALEEARQGRLASLAEVTTLVNAGSVLESFSVKEVSLVLHGHEHAFNCAWYASASSNNSSTCVIGADSITGNDSLEGCSIDRAGYNLIELHEDGSVTLEARRWTGGTFQHHFTTTLFSGVPVPHVEAAFSDDQMLERLKSATSVRMLIMRSESFFRKQAALLLQWMEQRRLSVEVLLPDPNNKVLMEQLQTVYNIDALGLATSIVKVVNLLRDQIYNKLTDPRLLSLSFHQCYPVYSAYLFDEQELWYFPYHYRANAPDKAPIFIYPHATELSVYKDFKGMPSKLVNLSQPLVLGVSPPPVSPSP